MSTTLTASDRDLFADVAESVDAFFDTPVVQNWQEVPTIIRCRPDDVASRLQHLWDVHSKKLRSAAGLREVSSDPHKVLSSLTSVQEGQRIVAAHGDHITGFARQNQCYLTDENEEYTAASQVVTDGIYAAYVKIHDALEERGELPEMGSRWPLGERQLVGNICGQRDHIDEWWRFSHMELDPNLLERMAYRHRWFPVATSVYSYSRQNGHILHNGPFVHLAFEGKGYDEFLLERLAQKN